MTFNQLKMALYATYLTNYFALRIKFATSDTRIKELRLQYSQTMLAKLNITLHIENEEKLPKEGQFLFLTNHKSVIDPSIVEVTLAKTSIYGYWIAKKELYNSIFFGLFVRNAGTILLDREASHMGGFFKEIKEKVSKGDSIFMFPEGTRNKTKEPLSSFKEGSRIIALKNKLPMLPIYIKTDANATLMEALTNPKKHQVVTVVIGDLIDYKDRSVDIEDAYRKMFGLKPKEPQADN